MGTVGTGAMEVLANWELLCDAPTHAENSVLSVRRPDHFLREPCLSGPLLPGMPCSCDQPAPHGPVTPLSLPEWHLSVLLASRREKLSGFRESVAPQAGQGSWPQGSFPQTHTWREHPQ